MFPNHSILRRDPSIIGEDEDALYCVTDDVTCCGTPPSPDCCGILPTPTGDGGSGNGRGDWYFPNGPALTSGIAQPLTWYTRWLTGAVLMNYRGTATTGTTGLHHCNIRDSTRPGIQQFYTCIYAETGDNIFSCKSTFSWKSTTCYMGTLHQLCTCMYVTTLLPLNSHVSVHTAHACTGIRKP